MTVTIPTIRSRGARFELVRQDIVESLATGAEVVAPQGVALWHYTIPLVTHTYAEAQEWIGALAQLTRMGARFAAKPPGFEQSTYVKTYWNGSAWTQGKPFMDGTNQTGDSVNVRNLVANQTFLERGDYIAFESSNHVELKIVTADAVADASGDATVNITPPLREGNAGEDVINVVNPTTLFRLKTPNFVYNMSPNRLVNMTIEAVESYGFDP